jgi:hypothetical protein
VTPNAEGLDDEGTPEEHPPRNPADIAKEARRLQADIDAYQKLKDAGEKAGDTGLGDYYDTQMQTIQNEINRLFGIRPNPWRGG